MKDLENMEDDLLTGAEAISKFMGWPRKRIYYALSRGYLPIGKVGHLLFARKSELSKLLSSMTDKTPGFQTGGMVETCLNVEADIMARLSRGEFRQKATDVGHHGAHGWPGRAGTTNPTTFWINNAKAELRLLGNALHNLSVELEGYATRIDELMKRAPEAVS